MKQNFKTPNFDWLSKAYFSIPKQRIHLPKSDVLILQGQFNDRLYLVIKGLLIGYGEEDDGERYEVFRATPRMFIGVYSYFSKTNSSLATVVAEEDSELAFIDRKQKVAADSKCASLEEEFMPMMVTELMYRQKQVQEIAKQKESAIKKLMEAQKLASLGQMAAGIAHELNNAIAVLKRNTEWIRDELIKLWQKNRPNEFIFFKQGISRGRYLSNMQIRKRSRELMKKYSILENSAEQLAQMDYLPEDILKISRKSQKTLDELYSFWEAGSTLHDMFTATSHASHVVNSIKSLGAEKSVRNQNLDINQSIKESLSLMHNSLKQITVKEFLKPLPLILANQGELIQVWTNLIKNAYESLMIKTNVRPVIWVFSEYKGGKIEIKIQDNGPGISKNILTKIFEPKFTTKMNGHIVGLGLGLAIVRKIIHSYDGQITVDSVPGKTIFTIQFPVGGNHGET
ncbi:ATP-binding protein [Calditrichota bacterium]